MKFTIKFFAIGFTAILASSIISCSDDKEEPNKPNETASVTIGFQSVPSYLIGGPTTYGSNLYYGGQDQITTGYLAQIDDDTYIQFPINYGYTYDADYNSVWGYSFFNGGLAVSNWHDMTDDTYMNQLSVYNSSSPSGGNFLIAFSSGSVNGDITKTTYADYQGCPHIYITDAKGYYVKDPGTDSPLTGDDEDAYFKSVYVNNTTYVYKTIENGNPYASALNKDNEGWFKVQFIAFDDPELNEKPLGVCEVYLANFKKGQADGYEGIIDTWTQVDLSSLPECSVMVINFVGSDMGEYGLNTPAYCSLDKFEIANEK